MDKPANTDDDGLPTIVVPLVLCPQCGGEDIQTRSSRTLADGSRIRYSSCPNCGQRFRIIYEMPGKKDR